MLQLKSGRPEAKPVPLGGGAVIYVRAATAFEVDRALAGTMRLLAGLVEGEEAAAVAAALLGEEFAGADFTSRDWIDAAAKRIALLELATLCAERWEGVADADGAPVPVPSREWLALLLRDSDIAARINAAVSAKVHAETAEKNASSASPNGGAGEAPPTAPSASSPATPAPSAAAAAAMASAVPRSPLLH